MDEQKPDQLQPGQVISPHGADEPAVPNTGAPEPERPIEPAAEPTPPPTPGLEPVADPVTVLAPNPDLPLPGAEVNEAEWSFRTESDAIPGIPQPQLSGPLTWMAAEFIEHEKSPQWYGLLALGGFAAAAIDYWITHDLFSTGVILFAVAAFGLFAARKPREQQYGLDAQGILVGNKVYQYHDFKTFSVIDEGKAISVVFMPLKRFMPPLTIYLTPDIEEKVLNFLSAFLPFEQHRADAVDSLLRRIRF